MGFGTRAAWSPASWSESLSPSPAGDVHRRTQTRTKWSDEHIGLSYCSLPWATSRLAGDTAPTLGTLKMAREFSRSCEGKEGRAVPRSRSWSALTSAMLVFLWLGFYAIEPTTTIGSIVPALAQAADTTSVFVNCGDYAFSARRHPASCELQTFSRGAPCDCGLVVVQDMRWAHWGAGATRGTGLQIPNHPYGVPPGPTRLPDTPISLTLSDPRRGCHGRLYYTKISTVSGASLLAACHAPFIES
jgi:hypothetical protein